MLKDVTHLQEDPVHSKYSRTPCKKPPECDLRAKRRGRNLGRDGWWVKLHQLWNFQGEGSQLDTAVLPHQEPVNVQLHCSGKNLKKAVADWSFFQSIGGKE